MPLSTPPPAAENCTVGTDGKLLDTKDIKWFHSPSNENTIGQIEVNPVGDENENNGNLDAPSTGRGHRAKKPTGKAAMILELNSKVEFSKKSKANK
ncbi:hypothetical protein FRC02_003971 [Tulasnella sp. 418]|nr:hypothetical protein FRC02_003971 [Tulasnella sp. 418]